MQALRCEVAITLQFAGTANVLRGLQERVLGQAAPEEKRGCVTEAWSVRIRRVMGAMGWPTQLMAERLGLRNGVSVNRLLSGGRPSVEVLLRLQAIEKLYAGEIEKQRLNPQRKVRRAYLWPPSWVRCNKRWWVERLENKPPARPADLAALGPDRTDPAVILTGRYDPRNYPGRTLRLVDWTAAGRARYAEDRKVESRRHATKTGRPARVARENSDGKEEMK